MSPAARNTAGAHEPVASRSTPETTGLATAPISATRLNSPNAEPRRRSGTRSPSIAWTIGCSALKSGLTRWRLMAMMVMMSVIQ